MRATYTRVAAHRHRPSILAALTLDARRQRLEDLGPAFADAFDEVNAGSGYIDTEERDELLDGLTDLIGAAPTAEGVDRQDAIDTPSVPSTVREVGDVDVLVCARAVVQLESPSASFAVPNHIAST